jgi:hypothetical protein
MSRYDHGQLCGACGGNGVIPIPGGVSVCPHCEGTCYEPIPAPEALVSERTVREFIGWLSADIDELHAVDVPRLADSWHRFKRTHLRELTTP